LHCEFAGPHAEPPGPRKKPGAQLVQAEVLALVHVSALVQLVIGVQAVHVSAVPEPFS
jgi:hypothetical protein